MRLGIASRSTLNAEANGDAYIVKELGSRTLLGIFDGVGHGSEASEASNIAMTLVLEESQRGVKRIMLDLHERLRGTRGVVAELVEIDSERKRLSFCGVGNTEARVISNPPMHPPSLDGILGVNLRLVREYEYSYESIESVILYSDGISSKFNTSDYPMINNRPQETAEKILADWGKDYDDATIIVAVEDGL